MRNLTAEDLSGMSLWDFFPNARPISAIVFPAAPLWAYHDVAVTASFGSYWLVQIAR